jgi:hypothetical protein
VKPALAWGIAMATLAIAPITFAQAPSANVIYRCTDARGAVALQDDPCPKGQKQETREIAAFVPATVPAPTAPVASTTPAAPETAPAVPASATQSIASPSAASATSEPPRIEAGVASAAQQRPLFTPPSLWRCTTFDGISRLSERFDPNPRCVPLSVLGVDLSRAPPSAATMCRTVEDQCIELSGDAACAAWEERLAATESALRLAFSDTQAKARAERDRAHDVVQGDCKP